MANRKMKSYQAGGVVRQVAGAPTVGGTLPIGRGGTTYTGPTTFRLTQAEAAKWKAGKAEQKKYPRCVGKSGQAKVNCIRDVYGTTVKRPGTKTVEP